MVPWRHRAHHPLEQRSVNEMSPEHCEEVAQGDCTPLSERLTEAQVE